MPKQRVSLAIVTQTAVDLVDRERSLDGLTISAVATELGIRPSALYTYFDGLAALRYAVAVHATANLAEQLKDAAVGQAGDKAVFALAVTYRDFAVRYPGQYASTLVPPERPGDELAQAAARLGEVFTRVIAGYGHTADEAVHAARTARSAIHGFVAIEMCQGFPGSTGCNGAERADEASSADASFHHLVTALLNSLR